MEQCIDVHEIAVANAEDSCSVSPINKLLEPLYENIEWVSLLRHVISLCLVSNDSGDTVFEDISNLQCSEPGKIGSLVKSLYQFSRELQSGDIKSVHFQSMQITETFRKKSLPLLKPKMNNSITMVLRGSGPTALAVLFLIDSNVYCSKEIIIGNLVVAIHDLLNRLFYPECENTEHA